MRRSETLKRKRVIYTSKELAVRLAYLAAEIRERASLAVAAGSVRSSLNRLYDEFKEAQGIGPEEFADMYAQTVACGVLSARISRPAGAMAEDLSDAGWGVNPILKELLATSLAEGGGDFDGPGLKDVVELLNDERTDMESVLRHFDDRNPNEDPLIHFYELFLKEYDPKRRMRRGVFYTPRAVVSFVVRSVDEILRREFGLEDGLADTTTWGEMAARDTGVKIPEGVSRDAPFVQILDPATGTGTFLVEVIGRIYETMRAKWNTQGHSEEAMRELWNDYVPRDLLPRLYGFELLMAPYAIAHMKLELKLRETKYDFLSGERARIHLTNTLEGAKDSSGYFGGAAFALAREAEAANEIKRRAPITVVIGNPPYSKISSNLTGDARAIVEGYRYVDGGRIKERGALQFEINLQDDYVKFVRWCESRLGRSGCGVMGMITSNGYLSAPTLRGMRHSLKQTFQRISVVDLHGHLAKGERSPDGSRDENVFEIQQGVAVILARASPIYAGPSVVDQVDVYGTQEQKYGRLLGRILEPADFRPITCLPPLHRFVPENLDLASEFDAMWSIKRIFPKNSAGIITARDRLVINSDKDELLSRIERFRRDSRDESEVFKSFDISPGKRFDLRDAQAALSKDSNLRKFIRPLLHRPFDERHIFYHGSVVWSMARPVASEMFAGNNLGLIATRQVTRPKYEHAFVSRNMIEIKACSHDRNTQIFPLYLNQNESDKRPLSSLRRMPNIDASFPDAIGQLCDLTFTPDRPGDLRETFGPTDIFHYCYGILNSCGYRARYFESLKSQFPRIPLTSEADLFRKLCAKGADLVALHLLEDGYAAASWNASLPKAKSESPLKEFITRLAGKGRAEVAKGYPKYDAGRVYVNASRWFAGVPEEVWNFHIGGYQVCWKWLKDRRGRALSEEDTAHYQRVVLALKETIRLMAEIDEVIESHGGWPLACSQRDTKQTSRMSRKGPD
ncbi:MAG TPA: type ISP restriction/modification enzyme [Blastocatellia bacterium]|nr:type ISP restriction/modification enzyme [Blastocatellia bacterium]